MIIRWMRHIKEVDIMSSNTIFPEGEDLRKAVTWISEQGSFTLKVIEEACVRFDLSPADESFLITHFMKKDN